MSSFDLRICLALFSLILSCVLFPWWRGAARPSYDEGTPFSVRGARSAPSVVQPSRTNPFAGASDLSMSQNLRDL